MHITRNARHLLPYAGFLGAGALVARLCPPSGLLLVFFLGLAAVAILILAAHRFGVPAQWGRMRRIAATLLILGLGPPAMATKPGPAPTLLLLSICFVTGFVLALAAQHGAT